MRVAVTRAAAFSLGLYLSAAAPGHAQSPPVSPAQVAPAPPAAPPPLPGVTPYKVNAIVRSAGFDPLVPPLREGATYVVRATDFRGILMRVVIDARTGAIRAVNRIVPGPGSYGPFGMVPPMPPPYGVPPPYAPYEMVDLGGAQMLPGEEASTPPNWHPAAHPAVSGPPLPRPRPAALTARKSGDDLKADAKPDAKQSEQDAKPTAAASAEPVARKRPLPPPFPE